MPAWVWKLIKPFWRMLPDKCEMPGCSRRGVRGNENIIDGRIVCDYCSAKRYDEAKLCGECGHGAHIPASGQFPAHIRCLYTGQKAEVARAAKPSGLAKEDPSLYCGPTGRLWTLDGRFWFTKKDVNSI